MHLTFFIIWFRLKGNISSPAIFSLSSIFSHNNPDIFAASLWISNYSFSCLILSLIVMVSFSILSKGIFLNHKWLSDAREVSRNRKEYGRAVHLF